MVLLQTDEGTSISAVHGGQRKRPQTRRRKLAFASTRGATTSFLHRCAGLGFTFLGRTTLANVSKRTILPSKPYMCASSPSFSPPLQVGGAQKPSCVPLRSISSTFDSSAGVRTRGIAQIKSIHVLRQRLTPFHSSGSLMLPFRTCVPFQRAVCGEGGVGAKSPPSPRTTEQTSPQVISNTLEM